jgi:pilus assembly protein CpaB
MNIRSILFLALALVVAGGTAFFARSWLLGNRTVVTAPVEAPAPQPAVQVLVAAQNLVAGQFVQARDLKWQRWPEEGLNEEYARKDVRPMEDFVGAVVRSAVVSGQPITDSRVVHPGDRGFLAAVLTPGLRAVSVPVNATTGISGFVFPGDLVDVLLTAKFASEDEEGKRNTRYFSETLLTAVRVLAIDQKIENEKGDVKPVKTVTLEVNAKHAEHIAIGLELGSLTLSLHSLAKDQKDIEPALAQVKLGGLIPHGGGRGRSFTMDNEVFHLLGSRAKGEEKEIVNVLRGSKTDESPIKGSQP